MVQTESDKVIKNCLEISGLQVCYGNRVVIENLTLNIPSGELVGILGPNGAGKTTLIHAISGFLKINQGAIKIFNKDVFSISSKLRATLLSLLPQFIETPFFFSVLEIVKMGRYSKAEPDKIKVEFALEALKRCNMAQYAYRVFSELSGGEKQLVLLARCLCQDSPLFLLDEATSNLDIKRKIEVFEILKEEVKKNKRSILVVIHDINLASLYLDRLIFMKNGSVVKSGKVEDVLTQDVLETVFETRTILVRHPESDRPAVLFSRNRS